ncbi:hypothetical protein [Azospirillum sp.]|uniref:hypothetical protein n=1 Tax=Azospirillum sp. TaxID=34012 RepID=UPI002D466D22|nr:hypothetical protein [Azospirillum sp.]HYD69479.1 hypothetical protein [Azospirillum sp.]
MIFAFFHTARGGEVEKGDREMIALAVDGIRTAHPDCRVVMLTDEQTSFDGSLELDAVVRHPATFDTVMYDRMVAQAAFVDGLADDEMVVFLDTDVLVVRPVTFARPFDVGVTVRPTAEIGFRVAEGAPPMPFQGGVLVARGGAAARRLFRKAVGTYDRIDLSPKLRAFHPDGVKGWYGDQYVLSSMLGPYLVEGRPSQVTYDDAVVSFLPCDRYNHSFVPGQKIHVWDLLGRTMVHFKGESKVLMPVVADALRQLKEVSAGYMAAQEHERAAAPPCGDA